MARTSSLGQHRAESLGRRDERSRQRAHDFAQAILLLGLALLGALYSSSVAQEGRVGAAALSAAFALLVAGWVGRRLVPRLAAGVEWDRIPVVSRYRLTPEGHIYLGSLAVVAVAAINTSNNLLYMILSALLAVVVLSVFLSRLNFRLIEIRGRVPHRCFAGEPFRMELSLINLKQVFPTFSLRVEPAGNSPFRFASFYLPVLRSRGQIRRSIEVTLPRRGRHRLEAVEVQSRYPFGFLRRWGAYAVRAECVAFPQILPGETLLPAAADLLGSSARLRQGRGIDLYMIRNYQPSDGARRIDWKASAKTSSLKSRQFAAEDSRRVVLVLDRYGQPGDQERFERLVSRAASHAMLLTREGADFRFLSDEWESHQIRSEGALEPVLYYLALVEMTSRTEPPGFDPAEPAVVFSLRSGAV